MSHVLRNRNEHRESARIDKEYKDKLHAEIEQ